MPIFTPTPASLVTQGPSLMEVITSAGLTTNLKLVLDAGDQLSYNAGQKWLDRSGGGYDFFLGSDGTSQSSDPTFNGNYGNQGTENFSSDGGDYFTYDSANETWMQALGKAGSGAFVAVAYLALDAPLHFLATASGNNLPADKGFGLSFSPSPENRILVRYITTANVFGGFGGSGPAITAPGLYFVGLSYTIGADGSSTYLGHVNGVSAGATLAANTARRPTTSNPVRVCKVMGDGAGLEPAPSGDRLYGLSVWQGTTLSAANFTSLWTALRGRYNL